MVESIDQVEDIFSGGSGPSMPAVNPLEGLPEGTLDGLVASLGDDFGAYLNNVMSGLGSAAPQVDGPKVFAGHVPAEGPDQRFRGDLLATDEPLDAALLVPQNWDDDELKQQMMRLWAAGFYPRGTDLDDLNWDNPREGATFQATVNAWRAAALRASDSFAAGQRKTVDDIIDEALGGSLEDALAGREEDAANSARSVTLSDPVGLRDTIDKTAQAVLGRGATSQEKRAFVALVHNMQRNSSLARQPDQGVGEGIEVDVGAQAEQFVRQQDPESAQEMDVAGSYRQFLSVLGAGGLGGQS